MTFHHRPRQAHARAGPARAIVAAALLALSSQPMLQSTHSSTGAIALVSAHAARGSTATGSITGVIVNERHEPVPRAIVQAFHHPAPAPQPQGRQTGQPLSRAAGSASTDAAGRFRISPLAAGDYLIAAKALPFLPCQGSPQGEAIYATTFHPSTADEQQAVPVSAVAGIEATVLIQLVRVAGARVSGSVVNPAGALPAGTSVGMSHVFGGFRAACPMAAVSATGTFETARVPPGSYGVSVDVRSPEAKDSRRAFAERLVEIQDRDIDGLSLVLGPGASVSGRVHVDAGANVAAPVGLRVSASPGPGLPASRLVHAPVGDDWSFHMTGLSGVYHFTVSADRPPFVRASRLTVDGVEVPVGDGVEFMDGATHDVVLFITPRELPGPAIETAVSSEALVERFTSEKVSWRQFETAKALVNRKDPSVLPALASWLTHENRRFRGNAAFVFAGLGDARGFQVITGILTDRSDRPPGEIAGGRWSLQAQIRQDRYYAVRLLGDLRDRQAVPVLIELLRDEEVNAIVPWALGEIGDPRAIGPLIEVLGDPDPSMRVRAIYALETLGAREALPRLTSLLSDHARSNFGAQVSVADAAKAAIAKLK
jgi:hypothetical protein